MNKFFYILIISTFTFLLSYEEGEYINVVDQNKEFDICYGSNDDYLYLADYNGDLNGGMYHVIHIDMAASW